MFNIPTSTFGWYNSLFYSLRRRRSTLVLTEHSIISIKKYRFVSSWLGLKQEEMGRWWQKRVWKLTAADSNYSSARVTKRGWNSCVSKIDKYEAYAKYGFGAIFSLSRIIRNSVAILLVSKTNALEICLLKKGWKYFSNPRPNRLLNLILNLTEPHLVKPTVNSSCDNKLFVRIQGYVLLPEKVTPL